MYLVGSLVVLAIGCGLGDRPPPDRFRVSVETAGTPAELEQAVALPLEAALAVVPGVIGLRTEIEADRVTLELKGDPSAALSSRLFERLEAARATLPPAVLPPTLQRVEPGEEQLYVVVSGGVPDTHGRIWKDRIEPAVSRLPGVRQTGACGPGDPEIAVRLDATALVARGVSVGDVVAALGGLSALTVETASVTRVAADVRLGDVARVERTLRKPDCLAWTSGGSVRIGEIRLVAPGSREAVEGALAEIRAALPPDVGITLLGDGPMAQVHAATEGLGPALSRALPDAVVLDRRDGRLHVATGTSGALDALVRTIRGVPGVTGVTVDDTRTVQITGPDLDTVDRLRDEVRAALSSLPGVEAENAEPPARPSLALEVDRARADALQIPMPDLYALVELVVGGIVVDGGFREAPVVLRLAEEADPERLSEVLVPTAQGLVALGSVVTLAHERERDLLRIDGQRAVELSVRGGDEAQWIEAIGRTNRPFGTGVALVPASGH